MSSCGRAEANSTADINGSVTRARVENRMVVMVYGSVVLNVFGGERESGKGYSSVLIH